MSTKAQSFRRPPSPPGLPLLGHSLGFSRDPLGFMERLRPYGDMTFLRLGGTDVYFLNHADLIRDVLTAQRHKFEISTMRRRLEVGLGTGLLTSRGELHARQRRLMQPVFRKSKIESYAGFMAAYTERQAEGWRDAQELDITGEMMKLAMMIVAKTLFDHEVEGESDHVSRHLSTALEFFAGMMSPFLYLKLKLPLPSTRRFRDAKTELDAVIYRMIEHRRRHPTGGDDLLTLLMQATDDETHEQMDERQLRDELMTLFMAGHETTANALSWTIYLLSHHPEQQEKLHAEVRTMMAGRSRVEAADVGKLPYARQVILEGLRLYPPAWFVGRNALVDIQLGGYTIPKGSNLLMSQYLMHRDPRYFEEPARFDPERWTARFMETLPRGAFFPFSAGDRHCIGESFAWLEALLVLSTIVQRWRFELVPGQRIRPKPSITLRPETGIRVRAYRRPT
jgi:cytochrome P450